MQGTMLATCEDKEYIFDPRTSLTQLGSIPATFMDMAGENRSIHPTHAVSAIGKNAKYLTESHHLASSAYGTDSPWDRLMKIDGRIIGLGVTVWPIPLFHVLEDMELDNFPLPVRMDRTYPVKFRNFDGKIIEVPVTPLDPKYQKDRIDMKHRQDLRDYFWQDFNLAGVVDVGKVGQAQSWLASAKQFYRRLELLMQEGITIYSTSEDLQKRPLRQK